MRQGQSTHIGSKVRLRIVCHTLPAAGAFRSNRHTEPMSGARVSANGKTPQNALQLLNHPSTSLEESFHRQILNNPMRVKAHAHAQGPPLSRLAHAFLYRYAPGTLPPKGLTQAAAALIAVRRFLAKAFDEKVAPQTCVNKVRVRELG